MNKNRAGIKSIFFHRLFNASGSYSTLYLSTLTSFAAYSHFMLSGGNHAILTALKLPQSKMAVIPASFFVGFMFGVSTLGDKKEFYHLLRNYPTYRAEFKMIHNELYYS